MFCRKLVSLPKKSPSVDADVKRAGFRNPALGTADRERSTGVERIIKSLQIIILVGF